MKLLCCRSRTYLMQPSPPCMPNVRRWRGLGGCGPQVCHPNVGAAGDGTGSVGPIRVRGQLPLLLACSLYSSTGSGQECRSSLTHIGLNEGISNRMLGSC